MGKYLITILAIALVVTWAVTMNSPVSAGEGEGEGEGEGHTYIGVAKCKTCHKSATQGEQFPIWEKR